MDLRSYRRIRKKKPGGSRNRRARAGAAAPALHFAVAVVGLFFVTGAGLAWLDIVDNWANSFTLVLTGVLEAAVVGWRFKTSKVLEQINLNVRKFRMPAWWFNISIKIVAPVILSALFVWNIVDLFVKGGLYGAGDGYTLTSNIVGGWVIMGLCLLSGGIVKLIVRVKAKKGFVEEDSGWDEISESGGRGRIGVFLWRQSESRSPERKKAGAIPAPVLLFTGRQRDFRRRKDTDAEFGPTRRPVYSPRGVASSGSRTPRI